MIAKHLTGPNDDDADEEIEVTTMDERSRGERSYVSMRSQPWCPRSPQARAPTASELRALFREWNVSGSTVATVCGVDARTVRRWAGGERSMPFAALFTLAHVARGIVLTPDDWRERLGVRSDSDD